MRVIIRFFGRVIRFVVMRVIPLVLIAGVVWSGYQVAQAVVRQTDEQKTYSALHDGAGNTATAIAQAIPNEALIPAATATETATWTDSPTDTPTDSPANTETPTESATESPVPTMTDSPTDIPTEGLSQVESASGQGESTPVATRQLIFATNTPRALIFATNTPGGGVTEPTATRTERPTPTETATATETRTERPIPTETASATATRTETPIPTETATATATRTETPIPTETASATATRTETASPTTAPTVGLAELRPLPTLLFPVSAAEGQVIDGVAVPTTVPLVPRDYNLVNIMLLGTDGELTDDGFERTDTMILVSINRDTGTVNMLSFPRDLYVYIPTTNGMMGRLNTAYGIGESIGWTDGGFGLLRQTILYNFGINPHYYAKVDFTGFKDIVDSLGGVNIAVDCAYQDYALIGAELPDGARQAADDEYQVIVDVGYYHMTGAQALWYARTRHSSTDFDRGRRQQQLLRAIWRGAAQTVNLTNVTDLWNQGLEVIDTDMNLDDVIGLLPFMLNLNVSYIESFTFIPTYHTQGVTVTSGGVAANVQSPIYDTVSQLMLDFYRPPSESQLLQQGATIAVHNGSGHEAWDLVAAERLQWEGYLGYAAGEAESYVDQTIIIDHTGQQKGSSLNALVALLNIQPENVRVEPDPNRGSDFTVILGNDYNSCNVDGVLDVGE